MTVMVLKIMMMTIMTKQKRYTNIPWLMALQWRITEATMIARMILISMMTKISYDDDDDDLSGDDNNGDNDNDNDYNDNDNKYTYK